MGKHKCCKKKCCKQYKEKKKDYCKKCPKTCELCDSYSLKKKKKKVKKKKKKAKSKKD